MPSTRSKTSNPAKAPYRPRKKPAVARSNLRTTVQTYLPLPSLAPSTRPSPDLFVWGSSGEGQLGLGSNQHSLHRPRKHPWVEQVIARGAFGKRPGAGILSVASGGLHTYLLDENGTIWSCGVNDDGALGRTIKPPSEPATSLDPISLQEAMQFGALSTLVEKDFSTVQLAAGNSSGAALNENGELRVWGTFIDGSGGKSFSGDSDEEPLPVLIPEIRNEKIASVSSGDNHFLALTVNGEDCSRREMNPLSPDKVVYGPRRTRTVLIGTGSNTSFAVDSAGDVWAWGPNGRGQLGLGDALVGEIVAHPTRIDALTPAELERSSGVANNRVVQICGGEFHTVFLTSSGHVYACGDCEDSQLGLPADHPVLTGHSTSKVKATSGKVGTPVLIPFPTAAKDDPVVSISCGLRFSMAVTRQGSLLSWGFGAQSELGLGEDIEMAKTPTVVVRTTGSRFVTSISCGGQHAVGLFAARA